MKLPKRILFAGFALMLAVAPMMANNGGNTELSVPQTEVAEVRFFVKGSTVRVVNAAKMDLQVYSLTGACVATYKIDSDNKIIALNLPKGIYILKVGEVARKISLR